MTVQEAVRKAAARGARGSDPRPLPAIPPVPGGPSRMRTAGPGPGRAFRIAFAASFAVHGLVFACFVGDLFGPTLPAPRPTLVATGLVYTPSLEPELPPLDLAPPEVASATPLPVTLVEVPLDAPEPLAGDPAEPPGPLPEIIGISSPRGFRRGVVGARGAGGSGGRSDSDPGVPVGVAACPAPPPAREPVLAAPRLRVDRLPIYPAALRHRGAEGEVRVRVRVGADGAVAGVEVAVSSGSEALDEAALEAARAWVFDPATEDGAAIAATVFRWVRFHLVDVK